MLRAAKSVAGPWPFVGFGALGTRGVAGFDVVLVGDVVVVNIGIREGLLGFVCLVVLRVLAFASLPKLDFRLRVVYARGMEEGKGKGFVMTYDTPLSPYYLPASMTRPIQRL